MPWPGHRSDAAFAFRRTLRDVCHTDGMRIVLVAALVLSLVRPSHATVIIPADLGELSHDALAIVRGRVASVESRYTEDRGTVETIVTLEAESYLKGALGQVVRFKVPGGELGRYRTIVVGAPEFAVDQRVIVFLAAQGPSVPHIVGFSQGVFRVARAADNSGWIVTPPAMLPAAGASVAIVRGDRARRPLPLADFEQRVRTLAGGVR
jgi:hypothetical protein